jgi:hypothetical protein
MITDREAMQMALEALEEVCNANILGLEFKPQYHQLITDLRAALSRKALDDLAEIDRELGLDYMQPDLAKVGEVGIWEGKPMIDYAHPLIVLDDLLKEIHQLCIDKRYEEAMLLARESIYELSVLQCNLAVMAHKNV